MIFFCSLSFQVIAQPSLDSLLQRVDKQGGVEGKLKLLDDLSWDNRRQYPQGAVILGKRGLQLAEDNEDLLFQEKFYSRIASAYFNFPMPDSAVYFLEKGLIIAQKRGNKKSLAGMHYNLSRYQNYMGNYPKALQSVYQAIELYERLGDKRFIALAHQRLGEIQGSMGHNPQAIEAFEKALRLSREENNTLMLIQLNQSIGTLKVAQAQKEGKSMEEGLALLKEAENLCQKQLSYQRYLPAIYSNLGLAYARMGNCELAVKYFAEGMENLQWPQANNASLQASIFENYGHCLIELGEVKRGLSWAEEALQLANKADDPRAKLGVYRFLVEAHAANKDYQTAFHYEQDASLLADQLRNEAREREIRFLQKDFELRQNELELREAHALQRKSQYGLYALLAGLLALGLSSFLIIQFLRKDQLAREQELKRKAEQERLQLLDKLKNKELQSYTAAIEGQEMERRRIAAELHDGVGGTMAALKMTFSSLSRKISPESPQYKSYSNAMQLLDNAVKEVRQLSHQMAAKQLVHEDLHLAIKELIEVLAQKDGLSIDAHLEPLVRLELNSEQKLHIYRLIQEHFQNTLKHARATKVEVWFTQRHNWLAIEYKDNGKGFDYRENDALPGLGLQNIEQRIKQLEGRWSLQSSRGKGIRSFMEIPLLSEYKGI